MTDQTSPGPPVQQPPPPPGYPPQGYSPQGYQQPHEGYGQPFPGYPQPRRPLGLAKLVFIAAWAVLGLHGLWFIYMLTQDDLFGADFGDRLFGGLVNLATGIFYASVLLALSVWLGKQKAND
ncbi:MAG: hypothetical protein ACRDZN_18010 [Acidimicrobiales bacterium]